MTRPIAWFELANDELNFNDIAILRIRLESHGLFDWQLGLLVTEKQYTILLRDINMHVIYPQRNEVYQIMGFNIKIIREIKYD